MTVLYVDTEHDRVRNDPEAGSRHRARIAAATARIAEAAGAWCGIVPYAEVTPARPAESAPAALAIGGSTADWAEYDGDDLAGLLDVVRAAPLPILGICAGHRLIGRAHGAPWGPLSPLRDGEPDPDPRFAPGRRKQRGFCPVAVDPASPLFAACGETATLFQSHHWQLESVPPGFVARAASPWSPIQAIERRDRPVFGVQFHPERHDAAHPDGAAVLRGFFALARRQGGWG